MPVFQNIERLVEALKILNAHENDIRRFYLSLLEVQVSNNDIDLKIKDVFAASVSERRAAGFTHGNVAVNYFNEHYNEIFDQEFSNLLTNNPNDAHKRIFEKLVVIPEVNQKIAAMFLKFLVVYLGEFTQLKKYLFVPVDGVVLKMLKEKLQVYIGVWRQSPSITPFYKRNGEETAEYNRFNIFQNELNDIADQALVDRIVADGLWFVGHTFCKEYPLCSSCWINELCQER
jgi:hypothetical protein